VVKDHNEANTTRIGSAEPPASNVSNIPHTQAPFTPDEIAHLKGFVHGNKSSSTRPWITGITLFIALVAAASAFYGNIILKGRLEQQVINLQGEVKNLEGKRNGLEGEISSLNSEKKLLEAQNSTLIEKNSHLESDIKRSLLQAFVDTVYNSLGTLEDYPEILVKIGITGAVGGGILRTSYRLRYDISDNHWNDYLDSVKNQFDSVASVAALHGNKKESIEIEALTFSLKDLIQRSIEKISKLSPLSKDFAQNLSIKIDSYIQKYPEEFQIPLNFRFTGITMTVKEANEERKRLYSTFRTEAEGETFESKLYAAISKLFEFLGYNTYDDIKKRWGFSK
jgi:hypothetical protein